MALGGGGIKIPKNKDPKKEKEGVIQKKSLFESRIDMILKNKFTLNFIMLTPFIMLLVSALSCYIPTINSIFMLLSNIFGFSIITNLYFLFYAYKHKFCMYSKVSIYTLLLLNTLNITHTLIDLGSLYNLYDQIIATVGVLLTIMFMIINKK